MIAIMPSSRLSKRRRSVILPLLQTLKDVRPAQRRGIILSHLDSESCADLFEVIRHLLTHVKSLSAYTVKKLRRALGPHKATLKMLLNQRANMLKKRKRMAQMGGFPFTAILSAAIPFLFNLLSPKRR